MNVFICSLESLTWSKRCSGAIIIYGYFVFRCPIPTNGGVRLITLICFGVEVFSHTICVSLSLPAVVSTDIHVGPAFLLATLTLDCCNDLTC